MAALVKFGSLKSGDPLSLDFTAARADGEPVDLTGVDDVAADLSYLGACGRVLASLTAVGLDGLTDGIDPAAGQVRLTLDDTSGLPTGEYYFDVRLTIGGVQARTAEYGVVTIAEAITDND